MARVQKFVFAEGELEGGRPEAVYSLDVVISVGYRVKSIEGVRFRRWATRVLREMLLIRLPTPRSEDAAGTVLFVVFCSCAGRSALQGRRAAVAISAVSLRN